VQVDLDLEVLKVVLGFRGCRCWEEEKELAFIGSCGEEELDFKVLL